MATRYLSAAMSAPTIDELTVAGDPESWSSLGFHVEDGRCLLGEVRLAFTGEAHEGGAPGLLGWTLRGIATSELDGLPTQPSDSGPRAPAPVHPNGVIAIDHIVAMSPAFPRSVEALREAGLDLRRIREEPTPAGAPRQAFFRLGEEILELVQEPEGMVARAGGSDRPARFWGLAVVVEDIERTVAALGDHGGEIRDAVQPGRRIATVRRSAGLSIPLALMSAGPRTDAVT